MPCDSIITNTVDLGKMDPVLLAEALKSMGTELVYGCQFGYRGYAYYTLRDGKLEGPSSMVGAVADLLKRNYSKRTVYAAAKRNGWTVKEISETKLQVIRR